MNALLLIASLVIGIDIEIETRKGEKIEGKFNPPVGEWSVGNPHLEVVTDDEEFPVFSIHWRQVRATKFGDPDVVTTRTVGTVPGVVRLPIVRMRTPWITRTFRKADLASLRVIERESSDQPADFGGTWRTTLGPMKLRQKDVSVMGTYGHEHRAIVKGRVAGRRLVYGYTTASGGAGEGWFEMVDDDLGFMGEFTHEGTEEPRKWVGFRAVKRKAEPRPLEIATGIAECMVRYHVRVPEKYDRKRKYPAILILHGQNMNSMTYIETIEAAWPSLAEDYVLIGIDGEWPGAGSTPDFPRFNYSYVNWVGARSTWKGTREHESPPLIAAALEEIRSFIPITKVFIGGHSQGGYLTYTVFMHYPEMFAGAFPISGGVIYQAEPSPFEDPEIRAAQRARPLAIVHGENDENVGFGMSEWAYKVFEHHRFPMVRLFAHGTAGHSFARLPVERAIRWLEGLSSEDPAALAAFAEKQVEEEDYGSAIAALLKAEDRKPKSRVRRLLRKIEKGIDEKAAPRAKEFERRIAAAEDISWVDDFIEFRRQFASAKAAKKCMQAWEALRERHEKPGRDLFYKAREEKDEEKRRKMWKEIVEKYYASEYYLLVKPWLE